MVRSIKKSVSIFLAVLIFMTSSLCAFAYDIDDYTKNRGMYIDLRKELPCKIVQTNDELFSEVERVFEQYEDMCQKTIGFQKKYVSEFGSSSKKTCDYLEKLLS